VAKTSKANLLIAGRISIKSLKVLSSLCFHEKDLFLLLHLFLLGMKDLSIDCDLRRNRGERNVCWIVL
jgi:hypothetical protein